jgi:hypothetical protein
MKNNVLVIPCVASKEDVIRCRIHGDIQQDWDLVGYTVSSRKPDCVQVESDLVATHWITATQVTKDKSSSLKIVYQILGEP